MQNEALVILGNQLFPVDYFPKNPNIKIFMMEDWELCTYEKHHKQKLIFFLSAMRNYRDDLILSKYDVDYYELSKHSKEQNYLERLKYFCEKNELTTLYYFEISDKPFREKFERFLAEESISAKVLQNPMFIFDLDEFKTHSSGKIFQMGNFYRKIRVNKKVLMENDKPKGGKWTYDDENRKKIPLTQTIPNMPTFKKTKYHDLILSLVHKNFSDHPGETQNCWIPTTRLDAKEFFCEFLNVRFEKFGDYEDAIDTRGHFLFHSGISALLNIGLLLPKEVISEAIKFSENRNIEMNNLEGFVRQIIGWREFIKGTYELHSEKQECSNFFKHNKRLSDHWYSASTGLGPLDDAIFGAIEYGYTHHINRLMVISNIMNLCEVDPKEIYKWFMEMFIDSSEWVMVPNVYGMSTFADGGIFASKPYICGSNYILKMGNSKKGDWCEIVDGLYWRFIQKNISFFEKNHRLSFMTKALNKIDAGRRDRIFAKAENFINEYTIS